MNPAILAAVPELAKGIGAIIDRIFPDKIAQAEQRAKAQLALEQAERDGTLKEVAQQLSAIIAEAQSPDAWTSRARPSFLYVMYLLLLWSIPMGIISAFDPAIAGRIVSGMTGYLAAIPDALYALFGTGYLGYATLRQWGKVKGSDK